MPFLFLLLFASVCFADALDIRVLRVEFLNEEPDNSLTTGRGVFTDSRGGEAYWRKYMESAKSYFNKASDGRVSIWAEVFPKTQNPYKLQKYIIEYNRTSRYSGEKMAEFDLSRAVDYARFVNDVLALAKADADGPLEPAFLGSKRVILIAHAGANRLVDGGTLGTRGANTPGDFMDAYIDTTWGEFWRGFEVSEGDTIRSVMVTSETADQDGLKWGIEGTITSQIGRELGLPYTFDVERGFSRLGYFDGMDFVGYNAGDGFSPSLPSAWHRIHARWDNPVEVKKNAAIEICSASCAELCRNSPQIVKIPINHNEYILLENRQRMCEGKASIDTALPASGIAAWHINDWYVKELLPYGAVNAWNGEIYRDHQFGIALIEADGVLSLGKEFKVGNGESIFYFGSGSDLIPHKKFKSKDTIFSISPAGYANTASTFGGFSGIKITAKVPPGAKPERTFNAFTGDSVITWQALKIPVVIEWIGKYAIPLPKEEWPYAPTKEDFANSILHDFTRTAIDMDGDGDYTDSVFLGNNRLYVIDANSVPFPNFPVVLSNGEPFTDFHSKPVVLDIDGNGSLDILVPANNGLILAANSNGRLMSGEFPIAAGTFVYEDSTKKKFPMLLYKHVSGDSILLFAQHRDSVSAFYLPLAKETAAPQAPPWARDEISEFFIFPNPVRGGKASMRFRILNPASVATLDVFDITGKKVFSFSLPIVNNGSNQIALNLSNLGSDIYSARLSVKFASGTKKEKWVRIGVVR